MRIKRIAVVLAFVIAGCEQGPKDPVEREADSSSIARVAVLPSLDSPLPAGKSAV